MSSQDDPPSKDFPEWDGWNVKDIEGSHMTYKALLRSTNWYTEEEITRLGQLALRSQTEKWKSVLQSKYMERFDSFGPAQSKWAEDRFTLFLKQQEKSVAEKDAYRHLVDSFLDDFVKTELGEDVVCRFHGSSVSGLCIGDSDVDLVLCLYGNTKRAFQERAVKRMQKDAAKALQQQPQTRHRVIFWGRRVMARAWRMDAQAALDLTSTNEYEVSDRVLSVSAILFLAKALCKKNACGGYRLAQRAKSGKEKRDKDVDTRIFAGCPVLVAQFVWWDDMGVEKRLRLNVSLFDIKAVTNTVFLRDLVSLEDRIGK
uniref:Poly(A) RNA polymerase mitochondrial-like central palm domain-containing protein n=1 Tax=Chromera velia CCMP2878 TaxID=1169474 RepID=A0A0G4IDS8_9ALVE|eukprot:Cvel_13392.t1-p1 / transcript=Cvel_13392.t1 / gene=Cvel_13392 / organism=Chromera_velia_CCMP2878 / gene_product=hypothetical protein / transcript_product=hypothetical protein / location=Cvel_scaffold912:6256-7194(-) / protein_length=313 / sequence_SO=supercontig / SO=protein_coding / is_pseudo=false